MIKPGVDNLIKWLQLNKIQYWYLSTTNGSGQDNTRIFVSDPDQSIESEMERMRQTLELCDNVMIYVFGKTNKDSKVGNYQERWTNGSAEAMPGKPANAVYGTPTFISREELDDRINEAVARERYRVERDNFDAEREKFRAEKEEFDSIKNSAIGIAVEKIAPFIGNIVAGLSGGGNRIAVAGTNQPVIAAPVTATMAPQTEELTEQDDNMLPFTIDEQERITAILVEYKNYDTDYLTVLDKFVKLAVSGQPISVMNGMVKLSYNDIKDFIINA